MHNTHQDCERWHESISLLASGCLADDNEADVRRHLADCPACATRFRKLTELCAYLRRGRPSAESHVEAIERRWAKPSDFSIPRRLSAKGVPPRVLWLSGVLAASLLAMAFWLANRQPPVSSNVRQGSEISKLVAPGKTNGGTDCQSQPTLRAYELAFAQSDEAFDALLQRHSEAIVFAPSDSRSLFQECFP